LTATSLHVGSLMQLMILRLFQKMGHKPIILLGGATSLIGDPSFRDEARKLQGEESIQTNLLGIKKSIEKFIKFGDGPTDAILVNNKDWLQNLNYIDFLRDFGQHFSVNKMLSMDSVKIRLDREQHLSFLEFNYMLMQAYDFMYLNENLDCSIQIGGSDQWGNIIQGVEASRKIINKKAFGITTPLLTTASGAKMGKTAQGAVWLNEDLLSPYDYYQYFRNMEDLDVIKFAKLFGEFNDDELTNLEQMSKININQAKEVVAHRITSICHGIENANQALETAKSVFSGDGISTNLPTYEITSTLPARLIDILVDHGIIESKSEAKKLIRNNAIKINDQNIEDELVQISESDALEGNLIKVSLSKKKHILLKI
jgi:tyrosyl-tRNA synthetase